MSVPTLVGMSRKKVKKSDSFIGKVSIYGSDRKHIEIPSDKRDDFESGDAVHVKRLDVD